MIDVNEACALVLKRKPGYIVQSCAEYDDHYVISLAYKDTKKPALEIPALVDKNTGEVSPFVNFLASTRETVGGFKLHDIDENGQSRGYEIIEQRPAPVVKRL